MKASKFYWHTEAGFYWHDLDSSLVCHDDVRCIRETKDKLLCVIDGVECWLDKRDEDNDVDCIDDMSEVYGEGHEGTLVVPMGVARQKGWCEYRQRTSSS